MKGNLDIALEKQAKTIGEITELFVDEFSKEIMNSNVTLNELRFIQLTVKLLEQTVDVNKEVVDLLSGIKEDTERIIQKAEEEA